LLNVPLERDEGEYAYAGQLMLQGVPPYKLAYNMKFPGTYAAYAAIMLIFGQTIIGIHLGLLFLNAATIGLIFLLGRQLVNPTAGLGAAIAYAILSLSPSVLGFAAHATHFVVLPVLGAILLLLRQRERKMAGTLFMSGLLFGIGLLMKQPAAFFILFGAGYLLWTDIRDHLRPNLIGGRILLFGGGAIVPLGLTCVLLWFAGVFDKFWFWTFDYARVYGSLISSGDALEFFTLHATNIFGASWTLWLLAGVGLVTGICDKATRASAQFLVGLLAASAFALSSGLFFRDHYFIFILPAVSLLVGLAISQLSPRVAKANKLTRFIPVAILALAVSVPILRAGPVFFYDSPVEVSRRLYDINPFPESIRIAEYVRDHTNPEDTIAVLGSEPQIYFYSNRHSATGHIYTYELLSLNKYSLPMQREMIREIEEARPKCLIGVNINLSWGFIDPSSLIYQWANEYLKEHYDMVGAVNILGPNQVDYYFGEMPKLASQPVNYILIYQRKS
jgi:hypothetical protein